MYYNKTFKINIFNTLASIVFIVYYSIMFTTMDNQDPRVYILHILLPGIPIFILICINLYFISKIDFSDYKPKLLLILITTIGFFISGLIQLICNKYLLEEILDLESYDPLKYLRKNIKISTIFYVLTIIFAIVYSVLDLLGTKNNNESLITASQSISGFMLLSLTLLLCNYFLIIFYATQLDKHERKIKILAMFPIVNFIVLNKNI